LGFVVVGADGTPAVRVTRPFALLRVNRRNLR